MRVDRSHSALVFALMVAGCAGDKAPAVPAAIFPQFSKSPADHAVFESGRANLPIFPSDPNLYRDDEGYHLFFTTIFCQKDGQYYYAWDPLQPGGCNILNTVSTTGYAFSGDRGLTWIFRSAPVVLSAADWAATKIETPFVVLWGDNLLLLFCATGSIGGQALPSRYQVGVAELGLQGRTLRQLFLDDNATFTMRPEPLVPLVLSQTGWANNTQEPSALVRDGHLEVFFLGLGLSLPDQDVSAAGQIVTSIGLGQAQFDQNLSLLAQSPAPVLAGINMPEVRWWDGAYHLFATSLVSSDVHQGEDVTYSTSTDGQSWSAPITILQHGQGSAFDSWGIMAPTAVAESDGYVLFYTGWQVEEHACFPVAADGRFGMPIASERCLFPSVGRAAAAPASQSNAALLTPCVPGF
jgi:hypothetical protein